MADKVSNQDVYGAVKALLPNEPKRAADVMAVVYAEACIDAGRSDEDAVVGLVRATDIIRGQGAGKAVQ